MFFISINCVLYLLQKVRQLWALSMAGLLHSRANLPDQNKNAAIKQPFPHL